MTEKKHDSDMNMLDLEVQSRWLPADENLLKEWADHAMCYKWLHDRAFAKFNLSYTLINIPIIFISAITGTANFAQDKFTNASDRELFSMVVGAFSLANVMLGTYSSFFKVSEQKESHRNCAKMWEKLYRNIQFEMVKAPSHRIAKRTVMEMFKKEYDRMVESAPILPSEVITLFEKTFSKRTDIRKPNISNDITSITINNEDPNLGVDHTINTRYQSINGRAATEFERDVIIEMSKTDKPPVATTKQHLMVVTDATTTTTPVSPKTI